MKICDIEAYIVKSQDYLCQEAAECYKAYITLLGLNKLNENLFIMFKIPYCNVKFWLYKRGVPYLINSVIL